MRRIAFVIAWAACGSNSPPPHTTGAHPPVAMHDNWGSANGNPGCDPRGAVVTLSGTLVVRPFGKGTDGAVIHTADGDWIVSYRADATLLALRDQPVTATGRTCDKQGQAIAGKHFDLATIAESR